MEFIVVILMLLGMFKFFHVCNKQDKIESQIQVTLPTTYDLSISKDRELQVRTETVFGSFNGWFITDGWELKIKGSQKHTLKQVFIKTIQTIGTDKDVELAWQVYIAKRRDFIPYNLQNYVQ